MRHNPRMKRDPVLLWLMLMGSIAACHPPRDEMPVFPWPPPIPTVSLSLPSGLVAVPNHDSLGAVFDRLRSALSHVDVGWWSTYAIDTTGFAIVTRMEAIEADGTPKPGSERWSAPTRYTRRQMRSIADYLSELFLARVGHYRVIAFAVTDRPLWSSPVRLTAAAAESLRFGGTDMLPEWLRRLPLRTDGRCIALIYEFEKPNQQDSARFVESGTLLPVDHLVRAGLWTEAELRR